MFFQFLLPSQQPIQCRHRAILVLIFGDFLSFFSSSTPHHGHPKQPTLPPNGRIHSHPPNLSGPALTNYKVLVVQSPKPSPLAPWSVYAGNFVGCAPSHDNLLTGFFRKKGY